MIISQELNYYEPKDYKKRISDNFIVGEYLGKKQMRLKQPFFVSPKLVQYAQGLRRDTGYSIHINSGYRSPSYNKSIGGAKRSKHMLGLAVDIRSSVLSAKELAYHIFNEGIIKRIGLAKSYVHIDIYPGETYWYYDKRNKPIGVGYKRFRSMVR